MKPDGMSDQAYERYKSDGFTEDDIERIWQETIIMRSLMAKKQGKEPREITSSTYIRAEKRMHKEITEWWMKR